MDATTHIRAYYDALRAGEPLGPFFSQDPGIVKVGISEYLDGYDAVIDGLQEQTRTTTDWGVESMSLTVIDRDGYACFSDLVALSWTDTDSETQFDFETRWSGTLERTDEDWGFLGMHVSAPTPLAE